MLLYIILTGLPVEVARSVDDGVHKPKASSWQFALQVGTGQIEEDTAIVLRGRLGFVYDAQSLVLSVPIWFRFGPRGTPQLPHWNRASTYLGMLESLHVQAGAFALDGGSLTNVTLGYGTLVEGYESSLDSLAPRTGVRASFEGNGVALEMVIDSFLAPNLIAAQGRMAPLAWLGIDAQRRFRVGLTAAMDPRAPTAEGFGFVGGGTLDATYRLIQGSSASLDAFMGGTVLKTQKNSRAVTLGTRLAIASDNTAEGLALTLVAMGHSRGFIPGYFDTAYGAERITVARRRQRPKAETSWPAGFALSGKLEGRLGPVRIIAGATGDIGGAVNGKLSVGLQFASWQVAARMLKRNAYRGAHWVTRDESTYAMLDASARIRRGLFLFTRVGQSWREKTPGLVIAVTDWVVGLGVAAWNEGA